MKLWNIGSARTTYQLDFACSPLFEAALGIAVATYDQIHHTLEHPPEHWSTMLSALPQSVQLEVDYAKKHNTWKTLLQLLHHQPFADLESFLHVISELSAEELRYHSLPFLGQERQQARENAAQGSTADAELLQAACRDHLFFAAYIAHITSVDANELRQHLLILLEGWYQTHIKPQEDSIRRMLEKDSSQKRAMQDKLDPEALVEWATGASYPPEPAVTRVLLIPQAIYRPWTVQADDAGTKIFYYPVADENMSEHIDPYQPPQALVQSFKALGDEQRLRMVKMLAEKEMSLQELTDVLQMSKSTVHHHLSMLRSARLVEASGSRFRLRSQSVSQLSLLLDQFLERGF
ncbi:transcriptional regulator [Brevibacillus parabrevis]|uniref:ArsR/SmtB family transcription factor n=1 Tax=Brevibacillus parabrevis TaxID=54914 RepID=UPI0007AB4AA3|nr:metalloregulator ArsR/SmtB family transcription factor [Brevibacillus parabrevis]KZE48381.1 transcriptional regulator [Brevibacillus parabrevis]